jgi:RNA polymerase sigma-70 factor (ECF subfamily)
VDEVSRKRDFAPLSGACGLAWEGEDLAQKGSTPDSAACGVWGHAHTYAHKSFLQVVELNFARYFFSCVFFGWLKSETVPTLVGIAVNTLSIVPNPAFIESDLVASLQKGEQAAIVLINQHYGRALRGAIAQVVKDDEVALDIFQDCLVKIWKKGHQYDPGKGRLFTWLLNVCRNAAIDKVRTKRFQLTQNIQQDGIVVGEVADSISYNPMTDHIGLKELVSNLDPVHKELIDLVYFGGRTQQEASDELQMPLGTVKTRLRKAIGQLRQWAKE